MRRIALLSAAGLVAAAAVGCKHVGGKCDPGGHPADAVPPPIVNPYPYAPVPAAKDAPTVPPPAGKDAPAKLPSGN
ncbi:MAG: hypothetical protein K2X82_01170 [Gemmataceae bacterium]|nr:hypothetical protein [Gemmataceae bacterium]